MQGLKFISNALFLRKLQEEVFCPKKGRCGIRCGKKFQPRSEINRQCLIRQEAVNISLLLETLGKYISSPIKGEFGCLFRERYDKAEMAAACRTI